MPDSQAVDRQHTGRASMFGVDYTTSPLTPFSVWMWFSFDMLRFVALSAVGRWEILSDVVG